MPAKGGIAFDSLQIRFGQDVLLRQDLATIFLIRDNMGKRPIFFSWSDGGYPDQTLGLSPYLVSQGFVRKLMPTPVAPTDTVVLSQGLGYVDVPRTRRLLGMCTTGRRPRAPGPSAGWMRRRGRSCSSTRWSTAGRRGCSSSRAIRPARAGGLGGARGEPRAERPVDLLVSPVTRTPVAG